MRFLASLQLAIFVLTGLALSLTVGTFLESIYTTQAARYWVYQAKWFHALLFLLGVNIFSVAVSRWPWKLRHIPFLLAHLGILTLLFGSWLTERRGIDGMMRVEEGSRANIVELSEHHLVVTEGEKVKVLPIKWVPPQVDFKPIQLSELGLQITKMISHSTSDLEFVESTDERLAPAVQVRIEGGPMQISQSFWLFGGDRTQRQVRAGPAKLFLLYPPPKDENELRTLEAEVLEMATGPLLLLRPEKNGGLSFRAFSPRSGMVSGIFKAKDFKNGEQPAIHPKWRGVTLKIDRYFPHAEVKAHYKPSPIQVGAQAPPPAIYIETMKTKEISGMWLGLGDRASFKSEGKEFGISYLPKQIALPFSIELKKFEIEYYPGSMSPKSYSSLVTVVNSPEQMIGMNEPIKHGGFTFYQASYEPGDPRPTVSLLSVNRDPGRVPKYLGSFLIILGVILLFHHKWNQKRKLKR